MKSINKSYIYKKVYILYIFINFYCTLNFQNLIHVSVVKITRLTSREVKRVCTKFLDNGMVYYSFEVGVNE